jgi:hypothetical protein
MAEVARELQRDGEIRGWRDELVSVADRHGAPELFRLERARPGISASWPTPRT